MGIAVVESRSGDFLSQSLSNVRKAKEKYRKRKEPHNGTSTATSFGRLESSVLPLITAGVGRVMCAKSLTSVTQDERLPLPVFFVEIRSSDARTTLQPPI